MKEQFDQNQSLRHTPMLVSTGVIVFAIFTFLGSVHGQSFNCATWGDEETQLIQLDVGESKTFQLPTASLDANGASCVDDVGDIEYEVRRSSSPVLPEGFTFDAEEVTVSGCSTEPLSGHRFNLIATGPSNCACTAASLEVVFRIKDTGDDTEATCDSTETPPTEDSVDLDQTLPPKPFYGWSQVHLGDMWRHVVGPDESEQGASITYGARCTGKYDLAENRIDNCPAFLGHVEQATYDNGYVYFTENISNHRSDIGIYRIRITAHKEDVSGTSQTTIVLEVVDEHAAPEPPGITAPELNTLHLVWENDEEERDYITGFDLEFGKVQGNNPVEVYELTNTTTSLTIGMLETDTQYQARLRIRGGDWSEWAQAYTLGNNAPTFEETEYTFTLTENQSGSGSRIRLGRVEATDPNPQDEVTYSLDSSDTDKFSIGESTGVLYYIGDGEDHETTPSLNVRVIATGGTGERAMEASVNVIVEVTNVPEPLAFAEDARIEIDDLTIGEYVDIQLPLAIGGDGPVSYSVDPELPDDLEIESRTGKLKGTPTVATKRSTYTYIATDVEGETDSLTFSFRIFGKAPKAPTNLTVQRAFADRITIEWENPSTPFVTVVSHDIEHRVKGTSRWKTESIAAFATTYTITGLTRNTNYQIRVKNIADTGHVGFSDILEAATRRYAPPSEPRNVTLVEASTDSLTLEWDKPADDGGRNVAVYDVRYRPRGGDSWMEEESRDTSYTITGLEEGTEYLVGVRAVNVAGAGPWSEDMAASTIRNSRPVFASGTSIADQMYKVGEAIAAVQLPSAIDGDGMLVYSIAPALPMGLIFNHDNLTLSGTPSVTLGTTTFTFTVADSDEFTDDDESFLMFQITVEANVPLAPTLSVGDIGYESAIVTWMMPDARGASITSYDLEYRAQGQQAQARTLQADVTATSQEIGNLLPQTTYEIRIRAMNAVGPSEWSEWTVFTTTKVPVVIRSRPLIHALGVAGSLLGEGAVERIGNRANLIDATHRSSEKDYSPPYYLKGSSPTPRPTFSGLNSTYLNHSGVQAVGLSQSKSIAVKELVKNFVLNSTNGPTNAETGLNWALWASFDTTTREANAIDVLNNVEIDTALDASTSSIWLGVEFTPSEDIRVGVAATRAAGDVDVNRLPSISTDNSDRDNVEFTITSVHPYIVARLQEQLQVWATFGRGTGSATLSDRWGSIEDIGLTANVFATGMHYNFAEAGEASGFALKGDLLQSDIETDDVEEFDGSLTSSVRRLRAGVQGRRYVSTLDFDFVLSGEALGRFEDGGVANGTLFDVGGQIDVFIDAHWSVGGQIRIVRSIEAEAYQAFGLQLDVRRETNADGTGVALQFKPSWGNTLETLARNLHVQLPNGNSQYNSESGLRSELEISYGIPWQSNGLIEPYGTITRLDSEHQLKLGLRATNTTTRLGYFHLEISSFVLTTEHRSRAGLNFESRLTF